MNYNPADIGPYKGKTFVTKHNYSISPDGKILGRPSIEGAEVLYIAGFESKYYWSFARRLGNKEAFDKLILEVGEEPRPELCLVVSLTLEASEEKQRDGLITSQINRIEDLV